MRPFVILHFLFLLSCPVSRLSSDTTDLQSVLKAFWEYSLLHHPNPSSLHLPQQFRGSNFKKKQNLTLQQILAASSFLLLLTLLFLLFLFLLMCRRVLPGVAAGRLGGSAAPVRGAAAAAGAASGAWGWAGASAGGAPSKRTRWSCRRKTLVPCPIPAAAPLWTPAGRPTPTPPTSRGTITIKFHPSKTCSRNIFTLLI